MPRTAMNQSPNVALCFVVPLAQKEAAIKAMRAIGAFPQEEPDAVCAPVQSPSILKGLRRRDGLTQARLAELTGISQRHISRMENGKLPIGKERAKRLATVFGADYRVFL